MWQKSNMQSINKLNKVAFIDSVKPVTLKTASC